MDTFTILISALAVFIAVSAGAFAILWIVLPFSIFGLKDLIKNAIAEQEKTNRLLQTLIDAPRHPACKEPENTADKTESLH